MACILCCHGYDVSSAAALIRPLAHEYQYVADVALKKKKKKMRKPRRARGEPSRGRPGPISQIDRLKLKEFKELTKSHKLASERNICPQVCLISELKFFILLPPLNS